MSGDGDIRDIVLVHGLWFRGVWLRLLARRLEAAGFRARTFDYPSTRVPLDESAARLQAFCEHEAPEGVHLAGHSLGGLLILRMLAQGQWHRPGRLLFLGTPLAGSAVARRTAHWPGASLLLGNAAGTLADGLHPNGGEAAIVSPADGVQDWPEDRCAGMIAGTRPIGLGLLSGGLERPHDGTVSLAETRHPGLSAHLTLPVTHTGLVYSRPVAEQAAHFLAKGHFSEHPEGSVPN